MNIGKYEIVEKLGEGGFATVYKAHDPTLDQTVALKVLKPVYANDPNFVRLFMKEAQVGAKLFHPNIALVTAIGEDQGRYYMAILHVDGLNLRDYIQQKGPLTFEQIAQIARDIGAALDYAHSQGILHRDVKPGNILINLSSGKAMLSDFGIAKVTSSTTTIHTTGNIMGTVQYMSPEQANGLQLDRRSDLYSLGVVLYELCTGNTPFSATSTVATLLKITRDPPPPPSTLNSRVSPIIETILLKAIAKKPDERYESGTVFAQAFEDAVKQNTNQQTQILLQDARAAFQQKDFAKTEDLLKKLLNIAPNHSDAMKLRMEIAQHQEVIQQYNELNERFRGLSTEAKQWITRHPNAAKFEWLEILNKRSEFLQELDATNDKLKHLEKDKIAADELIRNLSEERNQLSDLLKRIQGISSIRQNISLGAWLLASIGGAIILIFLATFYSSFYVGYSIAANGHNEYVKNIVGIRVEAFGWGLLSAFGATWLLLKLKNR